MQLVGNGSSLHVLVEMVYLEYGIKQHLDCALVWIFGLGGGLIMSFQKLLGKYLSNMNLLREVFMPRSVSDNFHLLYILILRRIARGLDY